MHSYEMHPTEDNRDYHFDDSILSDSPNDQSLIDSFDDYDSDDALFWMEQELLSDYDSDLRHPLYEDVDVSNNLSSDLLIDELVAGAADATALESHQISELLVSLEPTRLRYWLPRLRQKSWTGRSLLLFLQFRKVWDREEKWWEAAYWDRWIGVWRPVWNSNYLTLDDTYLLVQLRIHCNPMDIIEETWFEEWEGSSLFWKHGYFLSFAKYVVSRAAYPDKRKWLLYLNTIKRDLEC